MHVLDIVCVCLSLDRQTEKAKAVQSSDSAQVWKMKQQLALALCLQAGSSRQWSNILSIKVISGYKLFCFILIARRNKVPQSDC